MKMRLASALALVSVGVVACTAASALAAPSAPYTRPGQTELVSVTSDGRQASYSSRPGSGCSGQPSGQADISADGRYVVFASDAINLVRNPNPVPWCDIFWRDRRTGVVKQVNVASDGSHPIFTTIWTNVWSAPSLSANGRYVAFASTAMNLVPGDSNDAADIFVHDTRRARTVRVSLSSRDAQANGPSGHVSISGDGRYVAFTSDASNLVAGDTNGVSDVFVRDLKTKKTRRVSVSSAGVQAAGSSHAAVSISTDGRYVAFNSEADNLVAGDTTGSLYDPRVTDVFRHDLRTRRTIRVSVASDGSQASFAAFPSCTIGAQTTLPLPEPAGPLVLGRTVNICDSSLIWHGGHTISDDGRYITFTSNATNLVPNDTNYSQIPAVIGDDGSDVFVHDVARHRTERVSVDSFGRQLPYGGTYGKMSGDGRYVSLFASHDSDTPCKASPGLIVTPAVVPCQVYNAFLYDRLAGDLDRLSVPVSGGQPTRGRCGEWNIDVVGTAQSVPFGVSRNGRYVVMNSDAKDLVRGDTNDRCDYFVRDRGPALGVGAFRGAQSTTTPDPRCIPNVVCVPPVDAADLLGVRVVPRPGLKDLFVRWDVRRLSNDALFYGLAFTANGTRYEVRVQPAAGDPQAGAASFGLFRQDSTTKLFTTVASLKGGYGTVGEAVVTAVPLSALGGSAQLKDVSAYTAVGSYLSGATKIVDSLELTR